MPSTSDLHLRGGCVAHIHGFHGETLRVLSGNDAGKVFAGGVREIEQDEITASLTGEDPRAKRIIRFTEESYPVLGSQDLAQTEDGKKWKAVRRPDSAYLSVDYELIEVVSGKDT